MLTEKVGKLTIVRYDGELDAIPFNRMQQFDKWILIESNLGSDLNAVAKYDSMAMMYVKKGEKKLALQALENRRLLLHNIVSSISPDMEAYLATVYSINGVKVSIDTARKMLAKSNVSKSFIQKAINAVKKKLKVKGISFSRNHRQKNC